MLTHGVGTAVFLLHLVFLKAQDVRGVKLYQAGAQEADQLSAVKALELPLKLLACQAR